MRENNTLIIRSKSETVYLHLDDVLYIQADGNYSDIFFADGGVIRTLTYQRAEIARMIEEQMPACVCSRFKMLGRSYMVNSDYVLRIQPGKQRLTFRVNSFGTDKKVTIKATAKALDLLAEEMYLRESDAGE